MSPTSSGKYAVVTGASTGIGYELAAQFAQHGYDVLAAAENNEIYTAAEALRQHGSQVEPLQVDLATSEGVEQLYAKIQASGRPVDALVLNAGVGVHGDFARDTDFQDELNLINLNVVSPVHTAKLVIKDMIRRGEGKVLIVSSIAATMPGPFQAIYNGSKAFLKSFAEGIRDELKDTGVTITTLMPGATDTEFFHRAGMEDTKLGQQDKDSAAEVAKDGFEALMNGKDHVVAGSFLNKVQSVLGHVLPDTVMAGMHRKQSEPGSGNK